MTPFQRWLVRHSKRHPSLKLAAMHSELVQGAKGKVMEVGCGRGVLFSYYPSSVTQLIGVDVDPYQRSLAVAAANELQIPVRVVDIDTDGRLPAPDSSIDEVVCCEVLCTVPNPQAMLCEIIRVLRPGGRLHVFEHVLSGNPAGRIVQRFSDLAGWPRLLGGCHTSRETAQTVEDAGFEWIECRGAWYCGSMLTAPAGPHILGVAKI